MRKIFEVNNMVCEGEPEDERSLEERMQDAIRLQLWWHEKVYGKEHVKDKSD